MKPTLLIGLLLLTGCATPYASHQGDAQFQADYAQCDMEKMMVTGSDSMDIAWNRGAYMAKCMKAKGYTR